MVEHIVDFILGFVVCGLIGLAFLPMVSARARRLTLARIEDRLPMTFDEIEADRDLLRARFAVELRAMEAQVEDARTDRAGHEAELGRRAVAVTRAQQALAEMEARLRARDADLAEARDEARRLRAQADEARLSLAARQQELEEKSREIDELTADRDNFNAGVDDLNKALAGARARIAELEERRKRLLAKISAERKRGDELDSANKELRTAAEHSGAAQKNAVLAIGPDGIAYPLSPQQEMLDLREAVASIGRQVAQMQAQKSDSAGA